MATVSFDAAGVAGSIIMVSHLGNLCDHVAQQWEIESCGQAFEAMMPTSYEVYIWYSCSWFLVLIRHCTHVQSVFVVTNLLR